MSIIEEIKRDVRHDEDCESHEMVYGRTGCFQPCDCSHRRKIAWLERLEEPTERMNEVGRRHSAYGSPLPALLYGVLAAAEEDLP